MTRARIVCFALLLSLVASVGAIQLTLNDEDIFQAVSTAASRQDTLETHLNTLSGSDYTFLDGYIGDLLAMPTSDAFDKWDLSEAHHSAQKTIDTDWDTYQTTANYWYGQWIISQDQDDLDMYNAAIDNRDLLGDTPFGWPEPFAADGGGDQNDVFMDGDMMPFAQDVVCPHCGETNPFVGTSLHDGGPDLMGTCTHQNHGQGADEIWYDAAPSQIWVTEEP
jgi:hypothetical protein